MKLQLRYKDYGTSEMGYPYLEDEVWWEKEVSCQTELESAKQELYAYVRKEFSIDWLVDSLEEKSEKSYTLNHLRCEVVNFGSVIESWILNKQEFSFNQDVVEVLE